jgi:hypothetical protein
MVPMPVIPEYAPDTRAEGTIPEAREEAFKLVMEDPLAVSDVLTVRF